MLRKRNTNFFHFLQTQNYQDPPAKKCGVRNVRIIVNRKTPSVVWSVGRILDSIVTSLFNICTNSSICNDGTVNVFLREISWHSYWRSWNSLVDTRISGMTSQVWFVVIFFQQHNLLNISSIWLSVQFCAFLSTFIDLFRLFGFWLLLTSFFCCYWFNMLKELGGLLSAVTWRVLVAAKCKVSFISVFLYFLEILWDMNK